MLYYIDNERSLTPGLLDSRSLSGLIPSPAPREYLSGGPGGKPGLIMCDSSIDGAPRYVAEEQTWVPRFGHEGTYVGYWSDRPPTPSDLAVSKQQRGIAIEFLDGNQWIVPLLRQWRESDDTIQFDASLPTVLNRSVTSGQLVHGDVIRPLKQLWDHSCEIASDMMDQMKGGKITIDTDKLDAFVADLLAVNYRVTLDEIGLLGLLDVDRYREIVFAALDWDRLRALLGNLQSRLATVGESPSMTDTDSVSGKTQPTMDSSTTTAQQ